MRELAGRVGVITGAAEGIGRGIAEQFAAAGMRLVLADLNGDELSRTAAILRDGGADVLTVPTDVADPAQVVALADRTYSHFGATDVLCNNAGIGAPDRPIWEISLEEWARVLAVNFNGVLYGTHAFVQRMLSQGTEGHIVNTASVAGLGSRAGMAPYSATKHAVVSLTESLHHELTASGSLVKASVLVPGRIPTRLAPPMDVPADRSQMIPAGVGAIVVDGIRAERFYLFTHPEPTYERVRDRADGMLNDRLPTPSRAAGTRPA